MTTMAKIFQQTKEKEKHIYIFLTKSNYHLKTASVFKGKNVFIFSRAVLILKAVFLGIFFSI